MASAHFILSSRLRSARGASMGCRDEIQTRACLTASRRTTNWAAPHQEDGAQRMVKDEWSVIVLYDWLLKENNKFQKEWHSATKP